MDPNASNLSVENCNMYMSNCGHGYIFKEDIEPNQGLCKTCYDAQYEYLNPHVWTSNYAKDFKKSDCGPCHQGQCGSLKSTGTGWISTDPRLVSTGHNGQLLFLDRPPLDGCISEKEVYTDKSPSTGVFYNNYQDIDKGQIVYYTDKSLEDAFFYPVYTLPKHTQGSLYISPMDTVQPIYTREPGVKIESKGGSYTGCLSWMQDSLEQREDIISRQQLKNNGQKYITRWSK